MIRNNYNSHIISKISYFNRQPLERNASKLLHYNYSVWISVEQIIFKLSIFIIYCWLDAFIRTSAKFDSYSISLISIIYDNRWK